MGFECTSRLNKDDKGRENLLKAVISYFNH